MILSKILKNTFLVLIFGMVVTACATGAHSIGDASEMIKRGAADIMIAGGAEAAVCELGVAGFCAARSLSTKYNEYPEKASRPWDKDRDGFVMGEGSGILILEEYEHAKKRNANIIAEIVGYGSSGDAHHITSPPEDGNGAERCVLSALEDAKKNPEDIDYINAHGTSTPAGDIAETVAIKSVFEDDSKKIAISSTKSMIGHLLGAAGGVEAIFSVLSIRDQVAPPTINLVNQDPECDLDYIPHDARAVSYTHLTLPTKA